MPYHLLKCLSLEKEKELVQVQEILFPHLLEVPCLLQSPLLEALASGPRCSAIGVIGAGRTALQSCFIPTTQGKWLMRLLPGKPTSLLEAVCAAGRLGDLVQHSPRTVWWQDRCAGAWEGSRRWWPGSVPCPHNTGTTLPALKRSCEHSRLPHLFSSGIHQVYGSND